MARGQCTEINRSRPNLPISQLEPFPFCGPVSMWTSEPPSTTFLFSGGAPLVGDRGPCHSSAPRSPPSLFFLSDSLSFPVSSSHLLPARPFSPPSPQHSCCLAYSIYSGIFRVITIKLLKGDNPPEEARLAPSPILSLAWCSPAPLSLRPPLPISPLMPVAFPPFPTCLFCPGCDEIERPTEDKLSGRSP